MTGLSAGLDMGGYLQGSLIPHHVWGFTRMTHGIHYIALLMLRLLYDIIKIHSWIIRKKDTGRKWKNPGAGFLMFSPSLEE